MISDTDRLESLKALGAELVKMETGREFWGLFDRSFAEIDSPAVESGTPTLVCRSADLEGLIKDEPLTVSAGRFRFKRAEVDTPSRGFTTLVLKV